MLHPQIAKTERLCLRPMRVSDANAVYRYRQQPEVSIFQGWTPASEQEVADYANLMAQRAAAHAGHWYQVVLETNAQQTPPNRIIGDVAFCIDEETNKQAELGIALDLDFQKQGYAQEAISALVDYLFNAHSLHRIHVSIDPRNQSSLRLFERTKFRFEGHHKQAVFFKGEWTDDIIMAILGSEWLGKLNGQK